MDFKVFSDACMDKNSEISGKISALREKSGVDSLYLVHISTQEAVWGMRGSDFDEVQLVSDLRNLLLEYVGFDYNTDMTRIAVLVDPVEEVELIIDRVLKSGVESHDGSIKLESLNENSGEVIISLSGACDGCPSLPVTLKSGVENYLKAVLPWVRKVELPKKEAACAPQDNFVRGLVDITEAAARKIKSLVDQRGFGNAAGMRLDVLPGGCAGFKYEFKIEEKAGNNDEIIVKEFGPDGNKAAGRVFVTKLCLQFLVGSTLDYGPTKDGLGETFKINNPLSKGSCGCGQSDRL